MNLFQEPKNRSKTYYILNEIFSAVTHGIGLGLAIVALVLLIIKFYPQHNALKMTAVVIYGSSLILLYLFSSLFHSLYFTRAKRVFQIFDHSAIYILIAGSYTPYTLIGLGGTKGLIFCLIIWGLAILGILFHILGTKKYAWIETVLYIIMGWLIIIVSGPLSKTLGPTGLSLLIWGGVAYTIGAIFYAMRRIPFIHVLWHLFVMLGSILMFFSIYLYLN